VGVTVDSDQELVGDGEEGPLFSSGVHPVRTSVKADAAAKTVNWKNDTLRIPIIVFNDERSTYPAAPSYTW
jgi:hypothetical protein